MIKHIKHLRRPESRPLRRMLGNGAQFVFFAAYGVTDLRSEDPPLDGFWYWFAAAGLVFLMIAGYRGAAVAAREWREQRRDGYSPAG
ncbi:hypothetical protein ACH4M4_28220 [Streptomyces sp. NPDC017254]|uniref:hypothetical protein n=1 Tax=unclassified Streptomyces TaxID=2593676 RepID=UPI0037BAFDD2